MKSSGKLFNPQPFVDIMRIYKRIVPNMKNVAGFVSYSWDSDKHRTWVMQLASELQSNGISTYLDAWDVGPAMDLLEYMETHIRECDFVLLICTPEFAKKANSGHGGVGYEKRIVTGEIYQDAASPGKFVPILRNGDPNLALPSYLKSRVYIDFRDDSQFKERLDDLLRHLLGKPKYTRPPLGKQPELPAHKTVEPSMTSHAMDKDTLAIHKELFYYARHKINGPNLSTEEAMEFCDTWISEFRNRDIAVFQKAYYYARHKMDGPNLSTEEAMEFAFRWVRQFYDADFAKFENSYYYARHKMDGPNLPVNQAIEFAFKRSRD